MSRLAAICLLALVLAGCRNRGPDASYQEASTLYQQLYATQLDDAYGDPRMQEVVELLQKVNSRSSDAHAAEMLLGTIQRGREELEKQRAEREKMAAAAAQSAASAIVNIDPSKILAAGGAHPDGGLPQDPFGPGASVADLNAQSGGCLADQERFTEQVTGVTGTVYRVAPSDPCKSKMPGLVGQVVLVVDGKIYRRLNDPRPPAPAAPDAGPSGTGRPAPAPARPAQAADAGQPQYHTAHPGQQASEGSAPAAQQHQ